MPNPEDDPFSPGRATDLIREMALCDEFGIHLTRHAREQIRQRNLITDDVLHVLKYGFVYEEGEPSTRAGYFKYKMECRTPNSGRRRLRVVVIPSVEAREAKIVTAMWADDPMQQG